jgi:hypothetical protein
LFSIILTVLQWGSIESNGILHKTLSLISERRFLQRDNPLDTVSRKKIMLFIGLQIFGVACTVAISQTIAAIGFPVLIIALIPLRTFLMPKWFSVHELSVLDALTANNPTVLISFGGTPSGIKEVEDIGSGRMEDAETGEMRKVESEGSRSRGRSAARQRAGSIHR